MMALEPGSVLSGLVIFELSLGRVTVTRALAFSNSAEVGSPPELGLESLQFCWGEATATRSTQKRLDGDVVSRVCM
ncbi:hypothetical protein F5883DRAFT_593750 [Diaporthe sp. PMI_573]|jgi:hypothetical protein|nr:hypothetical protein F5883DRAFT_593750 [Diaporthaceae sp. PMI_573]